jgi:hypothetical protein
MRYSIVLFAAAVFVLFTAGGALAADPVYRFYNTEAGGHFYTTHEGERDSVIFDLPFFLYEGEAFEVSKTEAEGMVPVYRFHHPERGHYYTTSEDEKQHIQASFPKFTYEGEAFYAWDEQMDGVLPVYRFYKVETRTQFLTHASPSGTSGRGFLPADVARNASTCGRGLKKSVSWISFACIAGSALSASSKEPSTNPYRHENIDR